ncbi:hypothetical protein D1B33_09165 [Lysinibacillus yapensis]|uniref:Core domain-containing protein n=1 Tax=Ureibacillus yapensis TaxID=2304605 RepID=A0A396S6T7_9BACL|nr:iron-sulfur cluster biosynthesis family protein [Lysinibacillus yapensis]RHW36571.1 hypothetical protein D1B33_09165 [Lysinibacillus yapensis]
MMITITEAAMNKLKEIMLREGQSPRLDADVAGGCGMSVKLSLVFDEPRLNDTNIEYEGIQFKMDHFTKRYLNEETLIDYTNATGFLVGDSFEASACSIDLDIL